MPKKSRRRKPAPTPGRTPRRRFPEPGRHEAPDLLQDVARALSDGEPLTLLMLVSALLTAVDPRAGDPFTPAPTDLPAREELLASFLEVDLPETSALTTVAAELLGDDVLRRRVRRQVRGRGHVLPPWLAALGDARPAARTVVQRHVLGDGDNLLLGVQLPGGHEVTLIAYVDHNLGTVVKDAFAVPAPVEAVVGDLSRAAADPDMTFEDVDPADLRAQVTEAVTTGARTHPPLETDTWPASRPLLEWALRLLPDGGQGYRRPEWSAQALAELTERFFTSAHGAALDDADSRSLLESILWFATDYGPGDPLRWSPPAVEILLLDWLPRKIVADAAYLSGAPQVLRAFIRFCHAERGIRPGLTDDTLAAVDAFEPEYQATIRSARPQGVEALLAALGQAPGSLRWPGVGALDAPASAQEELALLVGGSRALELLDDEPLPDEPFEWDGVPDDVHERVAEVLALVDRCCEELLDLEYRTACRRLLARFAGASPESFRRRSRADTMAMAVLWVVGRSDRLFERPAAAGGLAVKDVMGWFGSSQGTASTRGAAVVRAVGGRRIGGVVDLGSPRYLTSRRRAQIIARREHLRSLD